MYDSAASALGTFAGHVVNLADGQVSPSAWKDWLGAAWKGGLPLLILGVSAYNPGVAIFSGFLMAFIDDVFPGQADNKLEKFRR